MTGSQPDAVTRIASRPPRGSLHVGVKRGPRRAEVHDLPAAVLLAQLRLEVQRAAARGAQAVGEDGDLAVARADADALAGQLAPAVDESGELGDEAAELLLGGRAAEGGAGECVG